MKFCLVKVSQSYYKKPISVFPDWCSLHEKPNHLFRLSQIGMASQWHFRSSKAFLTNHKRRLKHTVNESLTDLARISQTGVEKEWFLFCGFLWVWLNRVGLLVLWVVWVTWVHELKFGFVGFNVGLKIKKIKKLTLLILKRTADLHFQTFRTKHSWWTQISYIREFVNVGLWG